MFRFLAAPAGALCALAVVVPSASAAEFFATSDQSKITAGDTCLSEATPCALGKALDAVPGVPGGTNPNGVHTLTLLPGTYDEDDMDAGSPFSSFGMIRPSAGLTIQGKPGAPAPLVTTDPGTGKIFDLTGGILRNVRVARTTRASRSPARASPRSWASHSTFRSSSTGSPSPHRAPPARATAPG